MKYLKILCSLLTLGLVLKAKAQQDPHFSTYMYNLSVVNAAAAGTGGGLELYGGIRSQWVGGTDGPKTQTFNVNKAISDKVGLGLNVVNDDIFIVSDLSLFADFSYKVQISPLTNLFLGLKAGGSFLNIDFNSLGVEGDALLSGNFSKFNPNVGLGAYMKGDNYFVSLSVPRILKSDRFEDAGGTASEASNRAHFFLGGGYVVNLNYDWSLKPQTMAKIVAGAPLSLDLTLLAQYTDQFEFGLNYRFDESVTGIATFVFSDFGRVGFAYEYTTTDIQDHNNGTIEIFAKFLLRDKINRVPRGY